jgi:hypothetical protein
MASKTRATRVDSLIDSSLISLPHKRLTLPDLCDDVLLLICDFLDHQNHDQTPWKHLSLTNHRLRGLLVPQLFKTLLIIAPLKALDTDALTRHLHHARTLKIDMFGSLWWWCSGAYISSRDAIDLFTFIHSLPRLKRLEMRMMSRSLDLFSAAFSDASLLGSGFRGFDLRGVETLVVNSSAAFLVPHCPDLQKLVVKGKGDGEDCAMEKYIDLKSLFENAPCPSLPSHDDSLFRCARGLTSFDASAAWSLAELAFLTTTFPNIRHLVLRSESYCYRSDVASIMRTLGQGCKQLQTLQISKIQYLDVGYRAVWKRAVMECKTEEARRTMWKANEMRRVTAENKVARLAFEGLQALEELWVGDKRVARWLPRTVDQRGRECWMWERRTDEIPDAALIGTRWAEYRKEKEAVVATNEMGM